jgi:tetratricopeptide (TPR) repeat protein
MQGWDEEDYLAHFILAQVYQELGDTQNLTISYLKAFCKRPHRAEPLIKLAEYYYQIGAYHLCYLFARHACTIPYPTDDVSCVDNDAYHFTRYALLSASAYKAYDYELGKQATLKALQAYPDTPYLQDNLKYYNKILGL